MDFKDINQKIILQTSLFGVFMGIFSVLGWSQNSQPFIWLFTALITSFYLYKNLKNSIFINCMIIGLSWGFDCALVIVLFFKTYHLNNPLFVNELLNISSSYPKTILIATGLLVGTFLGFLIYILIYILKKLK
ncbi:MAG: Uncharacterised protein [Crocinitomicaceae bacterium]|nr:MAG: Uncharacterised protein [Crocinitomicaceae bacterium]